MHGGSLTFVRAGDQALVLVGLGTPEQAVEHYEALSRGRRRYWEDEPVAVMFAGTRRYFRPLGGGRALGVIEVDDRALVLGQVEGRLVLVHVEGAARVLVSTAAIKDLGVVDVDKHMALLPRPRPARGAPPQQVRQQHERITHGRELTQETSDAICMALQRLGLRAALAIDPARFGSRHRGRRAVMAFIDLLITLGLLRCGDLCGRVSDIINQIRGHIPGLEISEAKLGEVLNLLLATGTCLIVRPTPRTWRIRLAELNDVKGALHQKFCEETPTHFHLLPAADPAVQRLCGFDRSDLVRKSRRAREADATRRPRRKAKAGAPPPAGVTARESRADQPDASTSGDAPSAEPCHTGLRPPGEPGAASGRRGAPDPSPAAPLVSEDAMPRPVPPPRLGWSVLGETLSKRVASVASSSAASVRADRVDLTTSGPDPPPGATRKPDS
ncbi:MAG: hypothetical protein JNK56_21675 [Myxococcales bacterium]|nr:hypothetical protein [Myxococcales bacterium]